eukprot:scpid97137/ scgid11954/ 
MPPITYPEPVLIGTLILEYIMNSEKEDFGDPDVHLHDNGRVDPFARSAPYDWGPPLFAANATCVLQIHGYNIFQFHRTSDVNEFTTFISTLDKEYNIVFQDYGYKPGENDDEPDHTAVWIDIEAWFDKDRRDLAFNLYMYISIVWSPDGTSAFSVESLHLVALLPCTVLRRQQPVAYRVTEV